MPTEKPPTWESDTRKAERMAYAEKENKDKIVGLNKKIALPDLADKEKEKLKEEIRELGLSAEVKSNEANEKYDKHPKYEDDKEKAEGMAYAEKKDRESIVELNAEMAKPNLADEKIKELTEKINKLKTSAEQKGSEAGKEYDAYAEKRRSLQGVEDQLPYYKETALHEMENDIAERILKADNADQMVELANSMIATQESVTKDEKYVKKMSPLEWINYRVYKIKDGQKASFVRNGVSDDILKEAGQENLDRATKTLSDKETQILHLKGLIKNEVANSRNKDFAAVSENTPRLKELESEEIKLEKEVEAAKLWLKDAGDGREGIEKGVEASGVKKSKLSGKENSKETEDKSKTALIKGIETKKSDNNAAEGTLVKVTKREIPGWLKILGQMIGGLFLIGWSALFSSLERQVPGGKKGKKE